jgi:RNA polymerase sigma-70 factor, ECF subfamily
MMADCRDETLLGEIARGDEAAFRELYRRHTPAMYAVVLRLVGRRTSDAEDAIQEAWMRAVRGLSGFRRESTLRTWLIGIAIRCALEILRRRALPHDPLPDDVQDTIGSPTVRLDLEVAVANLADGYRHVLVLHDIEGYTHREIAALLGIDEGTSKSQLSRARRHLRRALTATQEYFHER